MSVPSLADLLSDAPGQVESLKLHLCQSLELNLNTVGVKQPFYQVRVEDTDLVKLNGGQLIGNGLDILVRSVRDFVSFAGVMVGIEKSVKLNLQVKDSREARLHYLDMGNVGLRLKTRNVEEVNIINTQIDNITENAVEVFYTKSLQISNSIFKHVDNESVTVNHVSSINVRNTLGVTNSSFAFLSPPDEVLLSCVAPYQGPVGPLYSWGEDCPPLRALSLTGDSTSIGAALLTTACVMILLLIILLLVFLHRKGRLDWLL